MGGLSYDWTRTLEQGQPQEGKCDEPPAPSIAPRSLAAWTGRLTTPLSLHGGGPMHMSGSVVRGVLHLCCIRCNLTF